MNWVSPKAIERRTDQDVNFMYYDGVAEHERVPNPQNFIDPAARASPSLRPTSPAPPSLSWRYRDPDKRDSAWAFVPGAAPRARRAARPTAPTASSAPT